MTDNNQQDSFEKVLATHGVLICGNVGDSMMPLLKQGRDKMVIVPKPTGRLKKHDVPLYRRDNGQYVLHRIVEVSDNGYVMLGDNRWTLERGITDQHIVGVLSAVVRKGETVPVTSRQYRCYVQLWCGCLWLRRIIVWMLSLPRRGYRYVTRNILI